jgi:hypothetical protein
MFKSAAEEIGEWADQCRRWARNARNKEQRLTLQHWERLFDRAALEADEEPDGARRPNPPTS